MFEDAKRPVTVELLRRLNLSAIAGMRPECPLAGAPFNGPNTRRHTGGSANGACHGTRRERFTPEAQTGWCQAGAVLGHEKTAGSVLISLLIEFGLPE
jgi:hypothetical protein